MLRLPKMQIRTPEGIVFSLQLAGPIARFLAWLIDMVFINMALGFIASLLRELGRAQFDVSMGLYLLASFVVSIGYAIVLEWSWRGQTLGKALLKLRVMDERGLRLQVSQVVMRNLLRFVDELPAFYLVGGLSCLLTARTQRLGDIAANTIVVRAPTLQEIDFERVLAGKFNSFRHYPHLCARLRQNVSTRQAGVALQAIYRREKLNPDARIELFAEMAGTFRAVAQFPPEVEEGLSDEQYVRNVVDVVFRS